MLFTVQGKEMYGYKCEVFSLRSISNDARLLKSDYMHWKHIICEGGE